MSADVAFDYDKFSKIAQNTAKAAKGSGNDAAQIKANTEKLLNECVRLAEVIAQVQRENQLLRESSNNQDGGNLADLQQQLKSKDAELNYLEAQVRKGDDEIIKLKAEKEMLLLDQMNNPNN